MTHELTSGDLRTLCRYWREVSALSAPLLAPGHRSEGPRAAFFLSPSYGTAKSGVGVSAMSVLRPDLMLKCVVPVVMAGQTASKKRSKADVDRAVEILWAYQISRQNAVLYDQIQQLEARLDEQNEQHQRLPSNSPQNCPGQSDTSA